MHDLEQALREEVGRLSGLPGAGADTMLARVHRRRRRNRIAVTAALGAVAVLATVAGVVWGLRPTGAPDPALPSPTRSAQLAMDPPTLAFPDADHGFALAASCFDGTCQAALAATADGGATWSTHPVPEMTYPGPALGPPLNLHALDGQHVALDNYDGTRRWFTADAGRTWTQPPVAPQGTVDEIPVGGLAFVQSNAGADIDIVVLRPDGTSAMLATPPPTPMISLLADVRFGADGSAWVYGGDDTHTWLWASRDRGRHWHQVPLPGGLGGGGFGSADSVLPDQGGIVYALDAVGGRAWRTTDDGVHWQPLTLRLQKRTQDFGLGAVVRFDGSLLVFDYEHSAQFEVSATGTAFTPAPQAVPMQRYGGRYVRITDRDPAKAKILHSVDGTTWTELRL
ncbi:hypothetical protein Cs7R123_43430 [Catellatospora sp. TT07R-123]|uniref:hypothetical protein n=1 Tax=Catellatospora sp. TT07R-123 TaxID=2733863 RepID=UPI001B0AEFC2|nr:hypothetical protein [Catellatospora sp. TT07R-123]GHJ47001.1 hypothetical protein Cs7R123_43430 [Catellatospora sp. TT07R-123]